MIFRNEKEIELKSSAARTTHRSGIIKNRAKQKSQERDRSRSTGEEHDKRKDQEPKHEGCSDQGLKACLISRWSDALQIIGSAAECVELRFINLQFASAAPDPIGEPQEQDAKSSVRMSRAALTFNFILE